MAAEQVRNGAGTLLLTAGYQTGVIDLTAPGPIGGTTPGTGSFTTINALTTSSFWSLQFSQFDSGRGGLVVKAGTGADVTGANAVGLGGNVSGVGVFLGPTGLLGWTAGRSFLDAADTILLRDASDTLALRHGTTGQSFRVYNTFTDSSNYQRGYVQWLANTFAIGTESAGTGSNAQPLQLRGQNIQFITGLSGTPSTLAFQFNASGHLVAGTDNTFDIGAAGSTRPRSIYAAGTVSTGMYTVGTLPSASSAGYGARAFVSDANATKTAGDGTAVVGGGANKVPVYSDNSTWIIG